MTPDDMKRLAAERAVELIRPGMKLGLGTGSTAAKLVDLLGARVAKGLDVVCVPTSEATRRQAEALGIRLATLDDIPYLDMTIDGTDEIDAEMRLIKGGGGALLREKIVAGASERMVVIADASKKVDMLGAFPLPIEVVRFGLKATEAAINVLAAQAGCMGSISRRTTAAGELFVTDNGNLILDCAFGRIEEPEQLADALQMVPGVVEHGLFLGYADIAIIAGEDGIEVMEITEEDGDDD